MSKNTNKLLLCIETDCLSISIKGPDRHPLLPNTSFDDIDSTLKIISNSKYEIKNIGVNHESFDQDSFLHGEELIKLCPMFFEQTEYELIIESKDEKNIIEFWHDNKYLRENIDYVGSSKRILSGIFNFENEIGYSDFVVNVNGKQHIKFRIEVYPTKMDYREDYKAIIQDITSELYSLIFDFLRKSYQSYGISDRTSTSSVEFFTILEKIYKEFSSSLDMILNKPHHQLIKEYQILPSYKTKCTDVQTIKWLQRHSNHVQQNENGYLVDKALAVKKRVSYDTMENRFSKYMLERTIKRLDDFKRLYKNNKEKYDAKIESRIESMSYGLKRRINSGILSEVESLPAKTSMSLVFTMAPGYRDLYKNYLLLLHGLSIVNDIYNISLKDLATLYEYWCFIKLNSLLRKKYQLEKQDIIKVENDGMSVRLVRGENSKVEYINPKTEEKISLFYNHRLTDGANIEQRPDNVLSLKKKDSKIEYQYVFDAKYKINQNQDKFGPHEEDINTMHRYRDAISKNVSPYYRLMFGAYILFPYADEKKYSNHEYYKSIENINIGGLPFLPSATNLVEKMLDELILDSPESAFERTSLPIGIEEKLSRVGWSRQDVLVIKVDDEKIADNLNNLQSFITVSKEIKDLFPIHYIALSNNGEINYFGEVITTQKEEEGKIYKLSKNPYEQCYLFEVKKWNKLDDSIKDVSSSNFYSTNIFLLSSSKISSELKINSEIMYRLYMELKHDFEDVKINNSELSVGDLVIKVIDRKIEVLWKKVSLGLLTAEEFEKNPRIAYKKIKSKIVKVVASIIVNNNKIFITQRGYGDFKDGWEFPGGKVEPGETKEQALIREIREELDMKICVNSYFDTIEYDYPNFHLSMDCFICSIEEGSPVLKEHEAARWVTQLELDDVDWLPADKTIIEKLKNYQF